MLSCGLLVAVYPGHRYFAAGYFNNLLRFGSAWIVLKASPARGSTLFHAKHRRRLSVALFSNKIGKCSHGPHITEFV